jgi:hypothetical protein
MLIFGPGEPLRTCRKRRIGPRLGMIRTLSAPGTFVQKYVFLVLWFCILGGINVLLWTDKLFDRHGGPPSLEAKVAFLAMWLAPPLVAIWLTRLLKRVRMSDEGLLISDRRREALVPFSAIASVSPPSKVEPFSARRDQIPGADRVRRQDPVRSTRSLWLSALARPSPW